MISMFDFGILKSFDKYSTKALFALFSIGCAVNFSLSTSPSRINSFLDELGTTLILTTNEPLDIDKSILKQTINIPILTPDKSDMLQVIKFYFNEFDNHECNMLADALIKKAGNNAYSNSQIKYLSSAALYANSSKNIDNVLELVKKLPPEITKTDIEKVNKEEKELQGLKNNENIAN